MKTLSLLGLAILFSACSVKTTDVPHPKKDTSPTDPAPAPATSGTSFTVPTPPKPTPPPTDVTITALLPKVAVTQIGGDGGPLISELSFSAVVTHVSPSLGGFTPLLTNAEIAPAGDDLGSCTPTRFDFNYVPGVGTLDQIQVDIVTDGCTGWIESIASQGVTVKTANASWNDDPTDTLSTLTIQIK